MNAGGPQTITAAFDFVQKAVHMGIGSFDAAVLGAFVHGRAGDLAAMELGQTALTATDLLDYLPRAFREQETGW